VTDYLLAGRYRLTDRIAAGGMGEVWRGIDQLLNRRVAVKLLPTVRAGDESSLARFRAEARFAASLSHSGIARVYDYGEATEFGGAYLVMELVDGEPLSAILARAGRLSAEATLDIIGQCARALDAAHQAGIVHRDIKPGNILIAPGGTAKITDFGIATAVRAAQVSHLTETGMVMGTAMYVSPEQATGSPVTFSSDIYSLGVVAFECLAGRPPYTANEPLAIAYSHKHDPVPPLPPDVPLPVSDLVRAMLAKTPEGRPPSARVVADRAAVLRDAIALGLPDQTRMDMPRPDLTRADLPVSRKTEERPYVPRQRQRRRRPLLGASLTVAICAVVAGISFFVSNALTGHPASDTGRSGAAVDVATTPASASTSASASASASPSGSPSSLSSSSPAAHHHKKPVTPQSPSYSPTPTATTASPTPSASASPSPTPSPTPTPTPTVTASPTPTPTPTVTPTSP